MAISGTTETNKSQVDKKIQNQRIDESSENRSAQSQKDDPVEGQYVGEEQEKPHTNPAHDLKMNNENKKE